MGREAKSVILSSDGDTHCPQYCTYSFADMDRKSILNLKVVDVREIECTKSTNMEHAGLE